MNAHHIRQGVGHGNCQNAAQHHGSRMGACMKIDYQSKCRDDPRREPKTQTSFLERFHSVSLRVL